MNIYSRIEPTQVLHIINRKRDIQPGRVDLVEADQFIQCAALKMQQGKTFKAHRHIEQHRDEPKWICQEAWIIIKGLVKVMLYDLDDSLLHTDVLEPGDISLTLSGAHNYEFMADESVVYEMKVGKYLGQLKDKVFINE